MQEWQNVFPMVEGVGATASDQRNSARCHVMRCSAGQGRTRPNSAIRAWEAFTGAVPSTQASLVVPDHKQRQVFPE